MAASYATLAAFVDDLSARAIPNRMHFLQYVKFARIEQLPGTVTSQEDVLAIGCAMAWGWIDRGVTCPLCHAEFYLGVRQRTVSPDGTKNRAVVNSKI